MTGRIPIYVLDFLINESWLMLHKLSIYPIDDDMPLRNCVSRRFWIFDYLDIVGTCSGKTFATTMLSVLFSGEWIPLLQPVSTSVL